MQRDSGRRLASTVFSVWLGVAAAGQVSATVVLPRIPDTLGAIQRCPGGLAWLREHRESRPREARIRPVANNPLLRAELMAAAESSVPSAAERAQQTAAAASNAAAEAAAAAADAAAAATEGGSPKAAKAPRTGTVALERSPPVPQELLQLRETISTRGVPPVAEVGSDGQRAAWSLVESAEDDPEFQLKASEAFARLGRASAVEGRRIGVLIDASLERLGQAQRYGTRYQRDAAGRIVRSPVDDAGALVARRRALGMIPPEIELCVRRDVDIDSSGLWLP